MSLSFEEEELNMIANLFQERIKHYPNKIAVKTKERELTFDMLNKLANKVANQTLEITQALTNEQNVVGLLFEHGIDMITGTLGAVKAGTIYVPLDPKYPKERLDYILEDSNINLLITNNLNYQFAEQLVSKLDSSVTILNIDQIDEIVTDDDLNCAISGDQIAYILYTSGSTGRPKGVIQSYENIIHFAESYIETLSLTKDDCLSLFSVFSHDAAILDIYTGLLSGATLFPLNIKDQIALNEISEWLVQEKITVWHSVPTVYRYFLKSFSGREEQFPNLRYIVLGGEQVVENDINMFQKLFGSKTRLINLYGQSESTFNSAFMIDTSTPVKKVTLGQTIKDTEIFLIDENGEEVSDLQIGEIIIASDHVALGYWKDPEKTKKSFAKHPELGRLYRTGDLGRVLSDGSIEFVGRKDFQVKIRGYRVELGEIESQLMDNSEIKEAVVVSKRDQEGNSYLSSFVVLKNEISFTKLKQYLAQRLPDYMVPIYFVKLDKLPTTPTGKVDRKQLLEMEIDFNLEECEYIAPSNDIEKRLEKIWSEILNVEKIGVKHNFFDLGGHSLKATALVSKVYKEFNVELPLRVIFDQPTILELAQFIANSKESKYTAIHAIEEKEFYPVSSAQRRIFIVNQFKNTGIGYNMPGVFKIKGEIDKEKLTNAFRALIKRHESLRTSFEMVNGEVVQKIHPEVDFEITNLDGDDNEILAIVKDFIQPFDLTKAPLLRVSLINSKDENYLIFDMHHIIADGTSMGILINDFIMLYTEAELPELRIQYKDFAKWQDKFFESDAMLEQENYWLEKFSDEIPVLNMSTDYPRPSVMEFAGGRVNFAIGKDLIDQLKTLSKEYGATLFMTLLAAYNVLLSKYSNQEDIIVGTPIAGRPHVDLEKIIGMFVNTLPLRNQLSKERTFVEFLQDVKENALRAYENQDYQFEMLVDKLDLKRDMSRNPLFDVIFVLQNMDQLKSNEKELALQIEPYEFEKQAAKFDLTLGGFEASDGFGFYLEYRNKLFSIDTIKAMSKHFVNILSTIAEKPETKIFEIEMISQEEKQHFLFDLYANTVHSSDQKTIVQIFEEQVIKTPGRIALTFEGQTMTYKKLNEKANQLARLLRQKGVTREQIVGIMVERSMEMVVGIIAIIKAGGAYLPIEPNFPKDRIEYMLENSQTEILMTEKDVMAEITFKGEMIDIKDKALYNQDGSNLELINQPNDLLYVIYTSGSTGKPKGVMIEHFNVVRLFFTDNFQYDVSEQDIWIMFHSFCFDVSVWEMYGALLFGGKLVIIPKIVAQDPKQFLQVMKAQKVTILSQTPTAFYNISKEEMNCPDSELKIRYIIFAGESLKPIMLKEWHEKYPLVKLINMYGITETTVYITYKEIDEIEIQNNISNIGKPIPTWTTYIFDSQQKLVPIGVTGEICIGGAGVSRGYLNRLELTNEKFIENPYIPGDRIYRSGDLAKWLPSGDMEYLGRIDFQVQIRGFRVELGEIESRLLAHVDINDVVVIDLTDASGLKYLVAYLISQRELAVSELRNYLGQNLPDYMIPSFFVRLEEMPITSNGKVNRRALPEPKDYIKTGIEYVAPTNDLEKRMADIWVEILGVDRVGIYENFFELGGHSLKATQLAQKTYKEFEVDLPLKVIFQTPTIGELAKYIANVEKSVCDSIDVVGKREYYPVSSAQKRLFALRQIEGEQITYNMPSVLKVEGRLELARFEEAILKLIERHEALRTSFELVDGKAVQRIHDKVKFELTYHVITEDQIKDKIKEFVRPFDLSQVPLFRVALLELETYQILIVDMHHIISDGISVNVMIRDLVNLYAEKELPELRIQYKDFAIWQNEFFASEKILEQEEFWLETFAGEIPVLDIPIDFSRPAVMSFEGDIAKFELNEKLTIELNQLANKKGVTLYMLLLAMFNLLLAKYSNQDDIIIGTPIAGRKHEDLENVLGMFVNTLVLRNYPTSDKTFVQFLAEVKERVLLVFENQDYQFEMLVNKLNLERELSRNPLFDVMFSLQNANESNLSIENLSFSSYEFSTQISKFDLTLNAFETAQNMCFNLQYRTKLFKKETIERLSRNFTQLIETVVTNPEFKISEVELLTIEEKERLLVEFNDTNTIYPEKPLHQIIEEQVEKAPDQIAVIFKDSQLTYQQLNEKANQLARVLRNKGVENDQIIGMMIDRSVEMMIGIIAILKAGGAYMPIDSTYPEARIRYMLEDSETKIILTQEDLITQLEYYKGALIDLKDSNLYSGDTANLESFSYHDSLAYVIYTSGTTGKPKGILTLQYNISRVVKDTNYLYISKSDRLLQLSNYAFDGSTFDIYGAFLNGATLVMIDKDILLDPIKLSDFIKNNQITIFYVPTALFNTLIDVNIECFNSVSKVVFGGERASAQHVRKLLKHLGRNRIIHIYGPTETTAFATSCHINELSDRVDNVPIGGPLTNTQLYVVDKYNQLQPIGVTGELCISGGGLARGYLNRPDLTAAKFVENPFVPGERMYRSGDLARWLEDGNIEFIGRIDHQVKIRGFRIELGEIESQLVKHELVKEAIVMDRVDENKNKYLCAYITSERDLSVADLREHLLTELPDYMIPAHFIQLEEMPLTSNGKINRKALPEPEGFSRVTEYVAPTNEVEEILAKIWGTILGVEKVGIQDNFFELGGDSIKAIQILSRANLEGINISVKDIFKYKTIYAIIKNVDYAQQKKQISQAEVTGEVLLTPVQQWFYEQDLSHKHYWNQTNLFALSTDVDLDLLEKAFQKLIEHHDAFRMVYEIKDERIYQYNRGKEEVDFKLELIDLTKEENPAEILRIKSEEIQDNLDLSKDLLIKAVVFDLGEAGKRLLIAIHHLIIDGVSWRILLADLEALVNSDLTQKLPLKTTSFKDWSIKIDEYAKTETLKTEYWEKIDSSNIQSLVEDTPEDNYLSDQKSLHILLDERETENLLKKVNWAYNTEINDILLAGLISSVNETFGLEDILIGMEGHGREELFNDVDLSRTIGWFTCIYPVYFKAQNNIEESIKYAKESFRKVPNKGIDFGLARYLNNNHNFDKLNTEISFNYLGQFDNILNEDNEHEGLLRGCPEDSGRSMHKNNRHSFLVDVVGIVIEEKLQLTLSYNAKYINDLKMEQLKTEYQNRLIEIIDHCVNKESKTYTVSDFGLENIVEITEFDSIVGEMDLNKEKIYPLTPMQEGILFTNLLDEESRNYYQQVAFFMKGNINIQKLIEAWRGVTNRYDVLKTRFIWKTIQTPLQIIKDKVEAVIYEHDISDLPKSEQKEFIAKYKEEDLKKKFDFNSGNLSKLSFIKLSDEECFLCWSFHHILLDGWSIPIILGDFVQLYQALKEDESMPIRPKIQFTDYLDWLKEQDQLKGLKFWKEVVEDFDELTSLPYDQPSKKGITTGEVAERKLILDVEKTKEINNFCKLNNITFNALIQTAWGVLLQKYNNTTQSCAGMTVSGRPASLENVEQIVGILINTLPVVIKSETEDTINDLLVKVNNNLVEIREYEYLSLADIQKLSPQNDELFDSLIVVENYPVSSAIDGKKLDFEMHFESVFESGNYNFCMIISSSDSIKMKILYNTELFTEETVNRIERHLVQILDLMMADVNKLVKEISIISDEEKKMLLDEFNDSSVDYPKEKTICQLFEEQVEETPDNIAVQFEDKYLTYRELNSKANQLARILRNTGISQNKVVGIQANRSLKMLVGVLAIVKAGGCYLPIDVDYPESRVKFMIEDSNVHILLTEKDIMDSLSFAGEKINLYDEELYSGDDSNLELINQPDDLIYIMYTSGSTGQPKGVMIEHKNVNRLISNSNMLIINEDERIMQTGSLAFDASTFEIWGSLLNGATLYLISKDDQLSADKFGEKLKDNQISMIWLTAPLFNQLVEEDLSIFFELKTLIVGGDALSVKHINLVRAKYPDLTIINGYGPTESTTFTTYFKIDKEYQENIPLGYPVSNTQVYILDKNNQLQPIGVSGELVISGDGLARGYLNRPELTKEKFVQNPFLPGERMYKTGDLARWRRDGKLEFLGRIDHQVKIRGFRIEIGEIETYLLRHSEIKETVVVVKVDDMDNKYLVAYFVSEREISVSEVRTYMKEELPNYMIPSHFIQLEKLPLTSNGKVNRKALPDIEGNINVGNDYVAPANEIEIKLAEIWSEILNIDRIGVNDDFFELGGHSLKVTKLASKVLKAFNVELPLKEVFNNPSIRDLADYVRRTEKKAFAAIEVTEKSEYYPLSSGQKRLFALRQLEGENTTYNIPSVMIIEGELDKERFQKAFEELIKRHDAFRTSFEIIDGEFVQKIMDEIEFTIISLEAQESELEQIVQDFIRPFDLSKAPLMRVALVKLEQKHLLMIDIHHIISDGVSMTIFIRDLISLYVGKELSELKLQYKDFSVWQNKLFESGDILKQEEYWQETFSGEIPVLTLPTDYQRPYVMNYEGETIEFALGEELTAKLDKLAEANDATLYMTTLAVFNILLAKYSGQEDIVVGSPIAGRRHDDLENIIGMFINTLAMRNYPKSQKTFADFLAEVKENALQGYENQDYQFEMLIDKLNVQRDLSRNPLFDVMFILQNMQESNQMTDLELNLVPYNYDYNISKFDLTLTMVPATKHQLTLEYSTSLFNRKTIERMIEHFINILKIVVVNPEIKISEIMMFSDEQRSQLLYKFNDTELDYHKEKTIHQLFEEQVRKAPEKTALTFEDTEMSYAAFNERANQLAHKLRQKGLQRDQIVGLIVTRSLDMMVGIMGILKAGGAYLPIDPEYPEERVKYMLEDSDAKILLTQSHLKDLVSFEGEILYLDNVEHFEDCEISNLENVNDSNDCAYVIYTSGSTGKPKGVQIQHCSVHNFIEGMTSKINFASDKTIVTLTTISFDIFVLETLLPLSKGLKVVIANEEEQRISEKFNDLLLKHNADMIQTTPSRMKLFLEDEAHLNGLNNLSEILLGGEALLPTILEKVKLFTKAKIYNMYGPTETTVWSTFKDVTDTDLITIGKPIANTRIYILDKDLKLVPEKVFGELYIAGDGLARGYLNRPELTQERFIPDPFVSEERMYKTGDLASWLADGEIEFIGRTDSQIKIRGYRIELGEIEKQLTNISFVKEAAVIVRGDSEEYQSLYAYVVADEEFTVTQLRAKLAKSLPVYMIPSYFVSLEEMPLTPNGKINRKVLALLEGKVDTGIEYLEPKTDVEKTLAKVWSEVLGVEKIGVRDIFFVLGGDSIKAIQISARLQKAGLQLNVRDLFQYPTIELLANYVKPTKQKAEQGVVSGMVELTPIQHWFFEQNFKDQHHFNQAVMLCSKNGFDEEIIEKVFTKIVEHHDALRMIYREEETKTVQFNRGLDEGELFGFTLFDLRDEEEVHEIIRSEAECLQRGFELEAGPLLQIGLFKTSTEDHLLIIGHHLVIDGVSWRILLEDFVLGYEMALKGEVIQFQDKTDSFLKWASTLNNYANSEILLKELKYWKEVEATNIASLPKTNAISENLRAHSREVQMVLTKEETEILLKDVHVAYNTEINDILLSALAIAFKEWSSHEKTAIILEGHGREEIGAELDLSRTIGWFTSQYPVILDSSMSEDLSYMIKSTKENLHRIPNKGIGYAILKYLTSPENKEIEFKLQPELIFNYLGQFDQDLEVNIGDCEISTMDLSNLDLGDMISSKAERTYPLEMTGLVVDDMLNMKLSFNKDQFSEDSMIQLINLYQEHLRKVIEHCGGTNTTEYTPSDIGDQELTMYELDGISELIEDLF